MLKRLTWVISVWNAALLRRQTCLLTCSSGQTQCLGNHDVWCLGIGQNFTSEPKPWLLSQRHPETAGGCRGWSDDRHRDLCFRSSGTRCNESGSSRRTKSLTSRRRSRLQSYPPARFYQRGEFFFFPRSMKDQTSERSLRRGQEVRRHKRGHNPSKPTPRAPTKGIPVSQNKPRSSSSHPGRKQQVCWSDPRDVNSDGKAKRIRERNATEVRDQICKSSLEDSLVSSLEMRWQFQKANGAWMRKHATDPHLNLNLLTVCMWVRVRVCARLPSSHSEAWEAVGPESSQQRPPCGVQWRLWWCMWRLTSIWTHPEGN